MIRHLYLCFDGNGKLQDVVLHDQINVWSNYPHVEVWVQKNGDDFHFRARIAVVSAPGADDDL